MRMVEWLVDLLSKGCQWLLEQGAIGLLNITGEISRFMTKECPEAFLLFGIIGVFFVMASAKEKGTKMVNLSILVFVIMKILGVCL